MFDNCDTLYALNMARVKACADGVPIVKVNNAYNSRRKQLLTSSVKFTKITLIENKVAEERNLISTLPYIASSDKPGTIKITKGGVYA